MPRTSRTAGINEVKRCCDLFNRRAGYLLIVGTFLLLLGVFIVLRVSGPGAEVMKVKVVPVETSRRAIDILPVAFDYASYYCTIIDNNLFRPLGWTPPRRVEPYRLLGTILPRDANTPPQTIVQAVTTNMTHIVTLGANLDTNTQVVDIQSKQVTLSTQGQQRTLMLPIGF